MKILVLFITSMLVSVTLYGEIKATEAAEATDAAEPDRFIVKPLPTVIDRPINVVKSKPVIRLDKSMQRYIGKDWKIDRVVDGSVNNDPLTDKMVMLIRSGTTADKNTATKKYKKRRSRRRKKATAPKGPARRILVFIQNTNGKMVRIADSSNLIPCLGCDGAKVRKLGGLEDKKNPSITIKNKLVTIEWLKGDRELTRVVLQFEYSKRRRKMMLLTKTVERSYQPSGREISVRAQVQQGLVLITRRARSGASINKTSKRIAKKKITLGRVSYKKLESLIERQYQAAK